MQTGKKLCTITVVARGIVDFGLLILYSSLSWEMKLLDLGLWCRNR